MITVKRAGLVYNIELGIIMALYVGLVIGRTYAMHWTDNPVLHVLIVGSPIVPIWLTFIAVARYYSHIDELAQRRMLEVLAVSFGLTACIVMTYSFLMDIGAPPLGIVWVWPVMAACWIGGRLVTRLRDR